MLLLFIVHTATYYHNRLSSSPVTLSCCLYTQRTYDDARTTGARSYSCARRRREGWKTNKTRGASGPAARTSLRFIIIHIVLAAATASTPPRRQRKPLPSLYPHPKDVTRRDGATQPVRRRLVSCRTLVKNGERKKNKYISKRTRALFCLFCPSVALRAHVIRIMNIGI